MRDLLFSWAASTFYTVSAQYFSMSLSAFTRLQRSTLTEADGRVRGAVSVGDPAGGETPHRTQLSHDTNAPAVDPFPDVVDGVPDVAEDEMSGELIRGALTHHGSLLVRGLIDRRRVDELAAAADGAFAARPLDGPLRTPSPPWYVPCEAWDELSRGDSYVARNFARMCNGLQLVDAPRALEQIVDAFRARHLSELLAAYLDEAVIWSVNKTLLRRAMPDTPAAWHQDSAFTAPNLRAVTVWVALSSCGPGTGAPGVAIVPRRIETFIEPGCAGAPMPTALSPNDVERVGDGMTVAPTFAPGDALLFDERTVHATDGSRPEWNRSRVAVVAWAFASSSFPESFVPLVI